MQANTRKRARVLGGLLAAGVGMAVLAGGQSAQADPLPPAFAIPLDVTLEAGADDGTGEAVYREAFRSENLTGTLDEAQADGETEAAAADHQVTLTLTGDYTTDGGETGTLTVEATGTGHIETGADVPATVNYTLTLDLKLTLTPSTASAGEANEPLVLTTKEPAVLATPSLPAFPLAEGDAITLNTPVELVDGATTPPPAGASAEDDGNGVLLRTFDATTKAPQG